jgi:hypothetical protein
MSGELKAGIPDALPKRLVIARMGSLDWHERRLTNMFVG